MDIIVAAILIVVGVVALTVYMIKEANKDPKQHQAEVSKVNASKAECNRVDETEMPNLPDPEPQETEFGVLKDIRATVQATDRKLSGIWNLLIGWFTVWIILVILGFIGAFVVCADSLSRPPMPPLY